ncbi:MAG TPA: glycine--tRNA ligase subunit beta, partial [Sulfurovum sp.]|nr:glycine--tRNA ligase subunit beta [Sulfurovum sp.]
MTKPLLIEIGVEELPAVPLLKIVSNIEKSWTSILAEYKLSCEFEFLYTPRRLVLKHEAIALNQPDSTIELMGPPVMAAIKDGVPTKAAEGFARKCGVGFDELGRSEKNGREVLYY